MAINMQENILLRRGEEGRAHIPPMPFWLGIVRIAQLVLAFLVMILSAYSSSVFSEVYVVGYGLSFYVFALTIIFLAYIIITPLYFPRLYVYWVQLIFEFKTTILWLSTFALLAEEAAAWNSVAGFLTTSSYWHASKAAIDTTKAAAGLGALTWLLFVVSMITFGIAVHQHRIAKAPAFASSPVTPTATQTDAEKGVVQKPVELNEVQPVQQEHQPAHAQLESVRI